MISENVIDTSSATPRFTPYTVKAFVCMATRHQEQTNPFHSIQTSSINHEDLFLFISRCRRGRGLERHSCGCVSTKENVEVHKPNQRIFLANDGPVIQWQEERL
jgi:hypothetical protein